MTEMAEIKFGTDGWRGVMARDFTFANLELVVQAVSDYVLAEKGAGRGMVVAYDRRFLAEQFAEVVAEVLSGNGIKVYLAASPIPTPAAAYLTLERGAFGALMLTASHNPPEYNGIKFIPWYGGPAMPEVTSSIEKRLAAVNPAAVKRKSPAQTAAVDPQKGYLAALDKVIDTKALAGRPGRAVVDPMFGSGSGYLEEYLTRLGWEVHTIHTERDAFFGGGLPEPRQDTLADLQDEVKACGADLGLALDGDADRFGIIDETGRYLPPNLVLALVYDHLLRRRRLEGPVARTVATTHRLDRIARHYGFDFFETPVGFKYIGEKLRQGECLLGGEESGGLSIKGHLPEKDGILAGLLVAEAVAGSGDRLSDLVSRLDEEFGPAFSCRWDLRVEAGAKEGYLKALAKYSPSKLGGVPVVSRVTADGTKLILADGSWVLVRPSGTEPLFRVYGESRNPEELETIKGEACRELGLPI